MTQADCQKRHYAKNRDRILARQHGYYWAHHDDILMKARDITVLERREQNAQKRQWRAEHRDRVATYNQNYYRKRAEQKEKEKKD